MSLRLGLILFWCFVILVSCNRKASIPSYLHLEKFVFQTDTTFEGSNLQDFQDAWVYMDGNLQGVYHLPTTVPIIGEGKKNIQLFPGIRVNGQYHERSAYPLTKGLDTIIEMSPEMTYTLSGKSSYLSTAKFHYLENFERVGISLVPSGPNQDDTLMISQNIDSAFQGGSGFWKVEPNKILEYSTRDPYKLPGNSIETFFEIHYRSTMLFSVGFYQETANSGVLKYPSIVTFYPSSTWKKAYIRCTDEVTTQMLQYSTTGIKMFFTGYNNTDQEQVLWIDNVKLVSR